MREYSTNKKEVRQKRNIIFHKGNKNATIFKLHKSNKKYTYIQQRRIRQRPQVMMNCEIFAAEVEKRVIK